MPGRPIVPRTISDWARRSELSEFSLALMIGFRKLPKN